VLELDPVLVLSARFSLALLFLVAAMDKLRHRTYFRGNLRAYELFPDALIPLLAASIPIMELAVSVAAFVTATAPYAMGVAGVLLGAYTFAMGVNLARGRHDIDCGCSGPARRQTLSGWLVARNIMLLPIVLIGAAATTARPLGLLDIVLCGFALICATVLYAATSQLIANSPHLDPASLQTGQP